ncbi:hypothetical protein ZIOFF_062696 [Zingiber officinale]|uniref:Uncharacterized protein n=1 Tax=Zingiber officinale TaxID=94328 RepID=A0A8J5KFK3_ZINOF|nr:hypothetical protein ZIOFF_062696 [Zingiber officinale]
MNTALDLAKMTVKDGLMHIYKQTGGVERISKHRELIDTMSTLFSSVSLAVLSSNPSFLKPSSSSTKLQLFFSHQDHLSFSFPRMIVSPSASTNLTVRTPPPSAIVSSSVPASMSAAGIVLFLFKIYPGNNERHADEGKMKKLISAITGHLASLGDGLEDLSSSPRDALTMVDVIERLGIQRYFQEQIHKIIHLSYLRWHEQLGFHDDADATLMGFRLLRLFGYYVTAVHPLLLGSYLPILSQCWRVPLRRWRPSQKGDANGVRLLTPKGMPPLLKRLPCLYLSPREEHIQEETHTPSSEQTLSALPPVSPMPETAQAQEVTSLPSGSPAPALLVSPRILDTLKGQFGDPSTFKVDTLAKVSSMIHLFKCSQVGFPSESTIMAQVKEFASFQLRQVFLEGDQSLLKANNLDMEIKFALEYPRRYLLPRLESRIVINQLWPGSGCLNKCLQLAKIDLGMLQKLHQQEIASLEQWWKEQECSKTIPFRGGILKSHFLASTSIYEPEYSAYRAAFTKCSAFIVTIDDLMDLPGVDHLDILKFNEAVQRWDPSGCDDVPKFKAILSSFLVTVEDMGAEASRTQGRDVLPYYKRAWQELIEGYTENAQWRSESRIPSMEEYLKASLPSISSTAIALSSLLMLPEPISDEALRLTGPGSRFMHLTNLVCRLTNDLGTFEFEARNGEIASAVSCYMKEHGCRQEEAMDALEGIIRSCWCELEWELFRSIRVLPECYRRGMISITRNSAFVYKRGDSYSLADDKEYAMLLRDYFFKPIH